MPRLSEQDLRRFRDRIKIAKKMQEDFRPKAELYTNYYKGKHAIRIEKPLDQVVVNYMLPMVEIKVAALAAHPPVWRFKPWTPQGELPMLVFSSVMPWVWKQTNVHAHARAALKDSKIYGFGVVKIGYRFETDREMFYDLTPEQFLAARAGMPDNALLPAGAELLELQGQYVALNPAAVILYDDVFCERVSPLRFFPEPEIDFLNLQRAEWIVEQRVRPLDEVKQTKRYAGTKDLHGDRMWELSEQKVLPYSADARADGKGDPRDRVTLWEIADRKRNLIATFAETKEDPLLVQDFPYDFEGYGYEAIANYEVPDEWRPLGDVQQAMPMQDEKNLLRSRAATRVRRLVDKYGLNEAALTDGTLEALESDQEGAIVKLSGPPTQFAVQLLESRGFPNDLRAHENNINEDFSVVTGQPEYARSVAAAGVETATEASILREMAGVRSQDDQARWDEFQARIGRKYKALIEQFYDAQRIAQVSPEVAKQIATMIAAQGGDPNALVQMGQTQAWVTYDRETVQAEGDVDVEAGSTAFRNRTLEQQRLTQQFQPLWGNLLVNQEELMKLYITRATDFAAEKDRLVIPAAIIAQAQEALNPEGTVGAPGGTEESVTRAGAQVEAPQRVATGG